MKCWYRKRKRKVVRDKEEFYVVLSRQEAEKLAKVLHDITKRNFDGILIDTKRLLEKRLRESKI